MLDMLTDHFLSLLFISVSAMRAGRNTFFSELAKCRSNLRAFKHAK